MGRSDAFALTNGTYDCLQNINGPGFDCFGVFEVDTDEDGLSFDFFLAAGETRTITLNATAFAFIETEIAAVPLPASAPILAMSLAGLWGLRRRKR